MINQATCRIIILFIFSSLSGCVHRPVDEQGQRSPSIESINASQTSTAKNNSKETWCHLSI